MGYEIPNTMKGIFIVNWFLFILGMYSGDAVITVGSVIIFTILGVGIEIIESIYRVGNKSN